MHACSSDLQSLIPTQVSILLMYTMQSATSHAAVQATTCTTHATTYTRSSYPVIVHYKYSLKQLARD